MEQIQAFWATNRPNQNLPQELQDLLARIK